MSEQRGNRVDEGRSRRAGAIALAVGVGILGALVYASAANLNVTSERITIQTLGVAATPTPTETFTCDLFPSDDAYVDEQNPTAANGSLTTLSVLSRVPTGGGAGRNRRVFVRFNLAGSSDPACQSLGSSSTVQTATLALFVEGSPAAERTYEVQRVAAAWSESTLTWNSAVNQGLGAVVASAGSDTPLVLGHMLWDVRQEVIDLLQTPALNNGWRIRDGSEGTVGGSGAETRFRSKEGSSPFFPRLRVVYSQ